RAFFIIERLVEEVGRVDVHEEQRVFGRLLERARGERADAAAEVVEASELFGRREERRGRRHLRLVAPHERLVTEDASLLALHDGLERDIHRVERALERHAEWLARALRWFGAELFAEALRLAARLLRTHDAAREPIEVDGLRHEHHARADPRPRIVRG